MRLREQVGTGLEPLCPTTDSENELSLTATQRNRNVGLCHLAARCQHVSEAAKNRNFLACPNTLYCLVRACDETCA